jgi:hypothetical protein
MLDRRPLIGDACQGDKGKPQASGQLPYRERYKAYSGAATDVHYLCLSQDFTAEGRKWEGHGII